MKGKKAVKWIEKHRNGLANIAVFILIFTFLFSYFKPEFILSETTTTGGDTASHYYPASYMKNYLLPHGKMIGWSSGWYAGFPMFQFYFPLPFLLMSIMSYAIGLQISFKLVTIMGTLLLPIFTFLSMKLMKFKFPVPVVAAVFTLPFLFMEANSMWGGNIPSTLAGEFSYSLSLALTVLFFGTLHRGLTEKKHWVWNAILFALIALTHVITMIFAFLFSLFFLGEKNWEKIFQNLKYLFKTYFLAGLLVSFFILPLIFNLGLTTAYADTWNVGIIDLLPQIIYVFFPLAALGIFLEVRDKNYRRLGYFAFCLLTASTLFLLAEKIDLVNIRFVPFMQLFLLILSSTGLGILNISKKIRAKWIVPVIIFFLAAFWITSNVNYIDGWIKWNYEGFENKGMWEDYKEINDFLDGGLNDGRVVYEHSQSHNSAGTSRAFESLPLFSGRPTLEGLYMQSSPTAPFVFYIQSEVSEQRSCPFWRDWECAEFDLERGSEHLKMFNVKHYIARSDKAKEAAKNNSKYTPVKSIGSYEVYELESRGYVRPAEFQPVYIETKDWKQVSYEWFKGDYLEVPIVFDREASEIEGSLEEMPREEVSDCSVSEFVKEEEILISTDCIGKPLIVSVSYHPNWKVEGAEGPYLVSPSFMLIYPKEESVRLYYGSSPVEILGLALSLIGIGYTLFHFTLRKNNDKFLKR